MQRYGSGDDSERCVEYRAMTSELLQLLEHEEIVLWTHYLENEKEGQRKRALAPLDEFIAKLLAAPLPRQDLFAEQVCRLVVDEGMVLPIRHSLAVKPLYPYLVRAYDGGSPRAPWWIAHLYYHLDNSREWRKWFETNNLTPWTLLEEALRREPTNDAARQELILVMAGWLNYAIHEVPSGVLYGVNGASIDECQELLDVLDQFRALTRASGALELWEDRIREWELHFRGYADYLSHRDQYTNYAHYLQAHTP